MPTAQAKLNLEKLHDDIVALHAAMTHHIEQTGDQSKSRAYRNNQDVKKHADAVFSQCAYLTQQEIYNPQIQKFQYANRSRLDIEDIKAIGEFGSTEREEFGGLMGAILNSDPDKDPKQTVQYYKLRIHAEIIDSIRSMLGREGSKKSNGQTKIFGAMSLQDLETRFDSDSGRSREIEGRYFGVGDEVSFGMADARGLFVAAGRLQEPHKSVIESMLYDAVESGDASVVEDYRKTELSNGHADRFRHAILALKLEYLRLDSDLLPESIQQMKENIGHKKKDPKASAIAVYDFIHSMKITFKELGEICDLSESRISQMHGDGQVPKKLIEVLGLNGLVANGCIYVSPSERTHHHDTSENHQPSTILPSPLNGGSGLVAPMLDSPKPKTTPRRNFMQLDRSLLDNPETEYQKSLGFRLAFHQMERDMSNHDLAKAIKSNTGGLDKVDSMQVHKWQTNQELPNNTAMDAMVQILIKENDKIADEDKENATKEFYAAYERTKQALARMQSGGVNPQELYAFSNKLFELRQQVGLADPQAFVDAITQSAAMDFPEHKNGQIDPILITRIHGNDHMPSNGMMLSMVKALDNHVPNKPINAADKKALYDLHVVQPVEVAEREVSAVPANIVAMREKLSSYFTDEKGEKVGKTEIGEKVGLAASVIAQLIGRSGKLPSVMRAETLEDYTAKFSKYLRELGKDESTIQTFSDGLRDLNEATREEKVKQGRRVLS